MVVFSLWKGFGPANFRVLDGVFGGLLKSFECSEFVTKMTLKSAVEDVKETTLAAIRGLLGKLVYLASLRHGGDRYDHWGMESVYGEESSQRALRSAHAGVVTSVLRTRLVFLVDDLKQSSEQGGVSGFTYVERMRGNFEDLMPGEPRNSPAAKHLSSVLAALSSLEKNRGRTTRSVS